MKDIIDRNYAATRKRGKIDERTVPSDFIMKLEEEVQEFIGAALHNKGDFNHELADIILVCLNISKHYGVDIESQMNNNIDKNEIR